MTAIEGIKEYFRLLRIHNGGKLPPPVRIREDVEEMSFSLIDDTHDEWRLLNEEPL